MTGSNKYEPSHLQMSDADEAPVLPIKCRGLSKTTAEHFGVKTGISDVNGTPKYHFFPNYAISSGKLVGYKVRDLTKSKKYSFSAIGNLSKGGTKFWNQQNCEAGGHTLFVFEGEYDGMAGYESLWECQPKPGQYPPNVVSLVFGANGSEETVAANIDFLKKFKQVVLVFDTDDSGKKGVDQFAFHYPDIKVVKLSRKDAHEVFELDGKEALYKQLRFNQQTYEPDDVMIGLLPFEDLYKPVVAGAKIDLFPKLNWMMQGIREREATYILAPSGVGKTTICKEIALSLQLQGKYIDYIMLEEDLQKTQQSMIAMHNNVPIKEFRYNPKVISENKAKETYDWLFASGSQYVKQAFGFGAEGMTIDRLHRRLKYAAARGCFAAIIDHVTMLSYGQEDKVGALDLLNQGIASIVNATGLHVFVISHIRRTNTPPPKNKDNTIKYPYWQQVNKEDARGSASIEQCAWNIIVLEPQKLDGGERGLCRIRVEKNREWDRLGVADVYTMDSKTGRLKVVDYVGE